VRGVASMSGQKVDIAQTMLALEGLRLCREGILTTWNSCRWVVVDPEWAPSLLTTQNSCCWAVVDLQGLSVGRQFRKVSCSLTMSIGGRLLAPVRAQP